MIITRTPLRVTLAGGGTDIPAVYNALGYGVVVNFAINKYIYVTVNPISGFYPKAINITSSPTYPLSFVKPLVKAALDYFNIKGGLDIHIASDIPGGTGLGSSSTLLVGLLNALNEYVQATNPNKALLGGLAYHAVNIELNQLQAPIGKQDQYVAQNGGVKQYTFYSDNCVSGFDLSTKDIVKDLESKLLLYYVGGTRSASQILKEQIANTDNRITELKQIREQAKTITKEILPQKKSLGYYFNKHWKLKTKLSSNITNKEVETLIKLGIKSGATGGKLLGAGGTGFVLFEVLPEKQAEFKVKLTKYKELAFKIDLEGSRVLHSG